MSWLMIRNLCTDKPVPGVFLWLPSPEFAIDRVADLVRLGGHSVPEETIRRRHASGVRNFFALYERLASTWRVHDNLGNTPPLIAERLEQRNPLCDQEVWTSVVQQGAHDEG
jgi:predicted ABC-type ATPase